MSYHSVIEPNLPGVFTPVQQDLPIEPTVRASDKQIAYATALAQKARLSPPAYLFANRSALSTWINQHKPPAPTGAFANYPSSKQVGFAERIARLKRSEVPQECFRDKTLMSRWIDSNKPR